MSTLPEIPGWRERTGLPPDFKLYYPTAVEKALLEENAELRARLGLAPSSIHTGKATA